MKCLPEAYRQHPAVHRLRQAGAESVLACLQAHAIAQPQVWALRSFSHSWTYAQLAARVQDAQRWWQARGVRAGDVVALHFEPPIVSGHGMLGDEVALLLALSAIGATVLHVYPGAAPQGWAGMVQRFGLRHWLGPTQGVDLGSQVALHEAARFHTTASGTGVLPGVVGPLDAEAPFLIEFTSGTTGNAKAVLHTQTEYLGAALGSCLFLGAQAGDVFVSASPWPSKVGLRGCLRALAFGLTHVVEPHPQTMDELRALVRGLGLNSLTASSSWQLRQLIHAARQAGVAASDTGLRWLSTAGAFVAPQEIADAQRLLAPQARITLASTEVGVVGSINGSAVGDAAFELAEGVEAQALDAAGQPLPVGQTGRLRVRTPWMCRGYATPDAAHRDAFAEGWFVSDDVGAVTPGGGLRLQGRLGEVINISGIKVQPRDVEQVLLAHPDVADCAVVSYPLAALGEIPVACVVLKHTTSMQALHQWLSARLDQWHMPRGLVVMQKLPRNADGKIEAAELRERYRRLGESG